MKVMILCFSMFLGIQDAPQTQEQKLIAQYQEGRDSVGVWCKRKWCLFAKLSEVEMDRDYKATINGARILSPDSILLRSFGQPRFLQTFPEYPESTEKRYFYDDIIITTEWDYIQSMTILTPTYKNGHGVFVGMPISEVMRLYDLSELPNSKCGALFVSRISDVAILYKNGIVWQIVFSNQH